MTALLKHNIDINAFDQVLQKRTSSFILHFRQAVSGFSLQFELGCSILSVQQDGLSAIHKAIIGNKQAIFNCLLRESANPFVRDKVSYICSIGTSEFET